jgi:predicted nucleotidyltransferase
MAGEVDEQLVAATRQFPEIAAAYLFGSRAGGQARRSSDVDVAVIFASRVDRETRFRVRCLLTQPIARAAGAASADIVDLELASPLPPTRCCVAGGCCCRATRGGRCRSSRGRRCATSTAGQCAGCWTKPRSAVCVRGPLVVSPEITAARLCRLDRCVQRLRRLAGMPLDDYARRAGGTSTYALM